MKKWIRNKNIRILETNVSTIYVFVYIIVYCLIKFPPVIYTLDSTEPKTFDISFIGQVGTKLLFVLFIICLIRIIPAFFSLGKTCNGEGEATYNVAFVSSEELDR